MRIGLLGDLQVHDADEGDIEVNGGKLRAFLVILALQAGRPVQTDNLVDALWGDQPPPAVRNGLQRLASKLRRALGATELITMRGGGYALELPPEAIDVHRFERLVEEARASSAEGDVAKAIDRLAEANALWRGDALAEFTYDDFAAGTITRLSEMRLTVIEERIDLELQRGRHQAVLAELEVLVASQPLRERPRALLMTALYRGGRQADALRVYQEGRRLLADELGLDPGPELRQLEAAILAQDPSLDAPERAVMIATPARLSGPRLPEAPTPLVGRDDEARELVRLLASSRLVTLVGPGGVGKTRLALEVARRTAPELAAGACLVELAPIGDPDAVRTAITNALELPDPGRLVEMISDRELLLVLDNCEHVIAAAAAVTDELLRRCPNVRLVATSREALRIDGESVWPVPPLPAEDAVELFLTRARAAGARLDASEEVRGEVADICRRLDGLPLAIELAAARTRAFPLHQLSSRLHDRFRLLTGGARTALPRQQTLRAVVDWSYELLFEDEQRLFERLSAFPGGCDLATARAVCADDALPADDIDDVLQALLDKSLIVAVPRGDDLRVTQLQTLAQYGREKLAERGDAGRIRGAMAAHFAALCDESGDAFTGDRQRSWLVTIDAERDNLRAALEWSIDTGDAETALTIAGGASWAHWLGGTGAEGLGWLDAAFACDGDAGERARALAHAGRGLLRFQAGVREGVDEDLVDALTTFRALGDVASMMMTYSYWAEVAAVRGELDEAKTRRGELLDFYSLLPDVPFVHGVRAFTRGKIAAIDGDRDASEQAYREALSWFSQVDRPMMTAMTLSLVADFDEDAGDFAAASERFRASIEISEACGLRGFLGSQRARLAWCLLQRGDLDAAELEYAQAVADARRLCHAAALFLALAGTAALHRLRGRDDDAVGAAREALHLHVTGGPRRMSNRVRPEAEVLGAVAVCCGVLGVIAADEGRPRDAALLLGHAVGLRERAGIDVPAFQRDDVARALAAIGDDGDLLEAGRSGQLGREIPLDA